MFLDSMNMYNTQMYTHIKLTMHSDFFIYTNFVKESNEIFKTQIYCSSSLQHLAWKTSMHLHPGRLQGNSQITRKL